MVIMLYYIITTNFSLEIYPERRLLRNYASVSYYWETEMSAIPLAKHGVLSNICNGAHFGTFLSMTFILTRYINTQVLFIFPNLYGCLVKSALCQWSYNFKVTTIYLSKTWKLWLRLTPVVCFLCIVSLDKHGKSPTASEWSYCTLSWSAGLIGSPHPEVNSGLRSKSTGIYTEQLCVYVHETV